MRSTTIPLAILACSSAINCDLTSERDRAAASNAATLEPAVAPQAAPAPLAAAGASLTIGTPSLSSGAIDLGGVAEEVERNLADLEACYARRLLDDPDLSGEVRIHWGITEEGKMNHACITEDTMQDETLVACVNQLVAVGHYPPAQGDVAVDVTFPFKFAPAGLS